MRDPNRATINWARLGRGLFENAPTLAFFAALEITGDLRLSGWIGAGLAALVVAAYLRRWLRPDPILLGITLAMLTLTPAVELLLALGLERPAALLIQEARVYVLGAVFLTGCALTALTEGGFLGAALEDRARGLMASLVLLGLSGAGLLWAGFIASGRVLEIALPLLLLFAARRMLLARLRRPPNLALVGGGLGLLPREDLS